MVNPILNPNNPIPMFPTISFFIAGMIVLSAIYLAITTNIIKSPSAANSPVTHKKYSFSRTQLLWVDCYHQFLFYNHVWRNRKLRTEFYNAAIIRNRSSDHYRRQYNRFKSGTGSSGKGNCTASG